VTTAPPPPAADPATLARLRDDLSSGGYDVEHLAEVLGPVAVAALDREDDLPALLAARASDDPAALLARVLTLGDPVGAAEAERALPSLGVAGAQEIGLIEVAGDQVRGVVDLRPVEQEGATWWVASDPDSSTTGRPVHPDHVLGVGGASRTLAELTVREPVGRALDIGTGCGVQALGLATHAGAVTATDISARALAYARFNTALAGTSVELRAGSMLEPAAGEQYDLVVSNPPFVITPRDGSLPTYSYRDGGRAADDLVADLVTGVREVLAPGGVAQLLGNWEVRRGQDWRDRVGQWLEASGLDGWVVQRELLDPAHYVETWLRDGGLSPEGDRERWRQAATAWLADLQARDVEAVGFGFVVLRRPASGTGRTERVLEEVTGPLGAGLGAVATRLRMTAWSGGLDDDALLEQRLRVAPDVTEERHLRPGAGDPEVILLRQGGGLRRSVRAGTLLAAVVGACDGELGLGQITAAVAALLDRTPAQVHAEVLEAVRGMLVDGLLAPTGPAADTVTA
jgi:methylase of polypeptide subunit release factors